MSYGWATVFTLAASRAPAREWLCAPASWSIDRAGIAQCMADIVEDETLGTNESLGITNR